MDENPDRLLSARRTFAALSYPNYRLWFFGQMISLFGTWMQSSAQGYLIYDITRSPAYLGYVGFASGIAAWIFMLWGGVVADRVPRRGLLIVTQCASMLLAFILSALVFARVVAPWHIIVMAFLLGVVNAFDAPARQAFVLEMVERKALTNAIALNSTMFNIALVVGPAIGGLTYAFIGPAWCFAVNGVSFIAVIAALAAMRLAPFHPPSGGGSVFREAREGLSAAFGNRNISAVMILIAATSLFGMSFATLIPAWAVQVLHGDALVNGLLQSARGLGAAVAALGIASYVSFGSRGKLLIWGSFLFPAMLLVFSLTRVTSGALVVLLGVGAANIVVNNLCNSLVQTLTPDAVRGRVMGIYTLFFFGFMPLGALLAGSLATLLSEPIAVAICAFITLIFSAAIAVKVPGLRKLE